jgi:competence/damage-inducible protein CinA-like protein
VLRGLIQERNAGLLARSLVERGVEVERTVIVGDALDDLVDALRGLMASGADLICTSGGLGPTHDDRTMEAVAEATGAALAVDPEALALVRAAYGGAPRPGVSAETQAAIAEKQAALPVGSELLPPVGTAPGCALRHDGTLIVVLPGPPWELEAMWTAALESPPLAPLLERAGGGPRRLLRLYGVVESEVVEAFARLPEGLLEAVEVGVCARAAELEIAIAGSAAAPAAVATMERAVLHAFGDAVYSRDGRTVEVVVADALLARGETLAVAESCTGGGLGARVTAGAGASRYFLGGVIAYHDAVKRDLLSVPAELLAAHGAVSAECATAMAEGARRATGSDWALSVTGVAGPAGGTARKPVGLVYVGVAGAGGAVAHELMLRGDRERIRERAVQRALHLLRLALAVGEGSSGTPR